MMSGSAEKVQIKLQKKPHQKAKKKTSKLVDAGKKSGI
jgi:hypothetical protein